MASIRQLSSGRWQGQIRRRGNPPQSKTFRSKQEAARWARSLESEIDRGGHVGRSQGSREVHPRRRQVRCEVTPSKKSARSERQRLLWLRRHFGRYSLARLRNQHIADYRDKRLADGLAGATVVKELNSLSTVIHTAMQDWASPSPPIQQS